MPTCRVIGCTVGYSSNPDKGPFATTPKDERQLIAWRKATKNSGLKPRDPICHNHFLPGELQTHKIIKDSAGRILMKEPYKCVRLQKGAIPSQFPWTVTYAECHQETSSSFSTSSSATSMLDSMSSTTMNSTSNKSGNCSVNNDHNNSPQPLITISQLKSIYAAPETSDIRKELMKKLSNLVKNEDWSIEELVDHSYSAPEITNCILYCLTTELIDKIMNTVKCNICKNALLNPTDGPTLPEAKFSQWNKESLLYHPNSHFYKFILYLESRFQVHCNSKYVFEAIMHDILESDKLSFPCQEHGTEMLIHIIQHFTLKRMLEYCARINSEQAKENQYKKKQSKWSFS